MMILNMFSSKGSPELHLLLDLCLLGIISSTNALHFNIPINMGTYAEETCHSVQESETRFVYTADAWKFGNIFQVKIVHENMTVHVTISPSLTLHRGFILNVTYGPRFYIFTVDDSTTRCRNVLREEYGAVCLWVGHYRSHSSNSSIHGCFAVAIKKKTIDLTGFEFGCLSANNETVNHTELISHGESGLHTFMDGASKGYHRRLCSSINNSNTASLSIIIPRLLLLITAFLSISNFQVKYPSIL